MSNSAFINQCFLVGRLVRDPEMRLTLSGVAVTRFTIAVDRPKRGEDSSADFIRVVAWNRLAEICNEYLKKGKLVSIIGRLQLDQFEKDGQTRVTADVIAEEMQMLDRVSDAPIDMTIPSGAIQE